MRHNEFVEWTHNGGHRGCHSSMLSAPLRPIHGRLGPMKNEIAALVQKQWVAATWVLCGGSLMSVAISILDFVQGHVLNDWSGIAPVNRLGAIPYRIAISIVVAFLVGTAAVLAQRPPLDG